jgi:hypothetical protein
VSGRRRRLGRGRDAPCQPRVLQSRVRALPRQLGFLFPTKPIPPGPRGPGRGPSCPAQPSLPLDGQTGSWEAGYLQRSPAPQRMPSLRARSAGATKPSSRRHAPGPARLAWPLPPARARGWGARLWRRGEGALWAGRRAGVLRFLPPRCAPNTRFSESAKDQGQGWGLFETFMSSSLKAGSARSAALSDFYMSVILATQENCGSKPAQGK